jgi:hypothetical protein
MHRSLPVTRSPMAPAQVAARSCGKPTKSTRPRVPLGSKSCVNMLLTILRPLPAQRQVRANGYAVLDEPTLEILAAAATLQARIGPCTPLDAAMA